MTETRSVEVAGQTKGYTKSLQKLAKRNGVADPKDLPARKKLLHLAHKATQAKRRALQCTKCGRAAQARTTRLEADGTLVHVVMKGAHNSCGGLVEQLLKPGKLEAMPATNSKYDGIAADRLVKTAKSNPSTLKPTAKARKARKTPGPRRTAAHRAKRKPRGVSRRGAVPLPNEAAPTDTGLERIARILAEWRQLDDAGRAYLRSRLGANS